MKWSVALGTFGGTVVRLHVTFLIFLAWLGLAFYTQGGVAAAASGLVFIALLFLCVVLHEFGHIAAARRYDVRTPDIVLLPIGGVARMERIPEDPRQEVVVALAGPAVNVVIAALLFLVLGGNVTATGPMVGQPGLTMVAVNLFWANVVLVLFNLLPAFPMDGGRVLRALLAHRMGYARGTRIAAGIGQGLAFGFGLLGLLAGNPLLLFVALFVYLAAASESPRGAVAPSRAGHPRVRRDDHEFSQRPPQRQPPGGAGSLGSDRPGGGSRRRRRGPAARDRHP
jgi:Zn-dependent protease